MGACAQIAVFTFAYAANALLCLYSVAAWAQEIGTSFSVPFFRLNVGTDDRSKLLCTLLPPQRGHRGQAQASLCPSSASAWAQETGSSFSVPLNQGMGRYTQNLIITPRMPKTTGAYLTKFDDYAPHNE